MTAIPDIDDAALQARAREDLRQAAVEARQAIARRQPAPDLDPSELFQALHLLFAPGSAISPVEQLIEDWYELARQCGINVNDENGELRPEIDEAITSVVTASIWFGITTGHHAIEGGAHFVPRKLSGWA
jgi:hypothetical protein